MTIHTFSELIDIEQVRQLLDAHYKISGMLSAILDTDENILIAVGWQDICSHFHRHHPETCVRCRESDAYIKNHLQDFTGEYLEYKCKNGLRDVAMPIIIAGEHLATFFIGQFFYDDDKPDVEFFRQQAGIFEFDEQSYLEALGRVPVFSREYIRNSIDYFRKLVKVMVELGLKNLELVQEVEERKKAGMTTRESRDYLDKIINSISDPLFVKDRQHRLILVNDAECALAGRTREELLGHTDYDFFPSDQVDVFWEMDELVFKTGQENINEEEISNAKGEKRTIVTKKTLSKGVNESPYIVGIIRDITELKRTEQALRLLNEELESRVVARTAELVRENAERKRVEEELRESEQKYKVIVEAFDGLIYICSPDYRIEFMNKRFIDQVGFNAVGSVCHQALLGRDSSCPWCVNDQVFAGKTVRWELQMAEERWFYVVNAPIYHADGSISKLSMLMDITERKLAEEQLRQKKQLLEALNSTLEKRVQEEVAKNREKDIILIQQNREAALGETLEHIAHQWRQPINAISLIVQDLEETYSCNELTDDYVHETVGKTISLLEHMSQTIGVFRDFYKPDRGKTSFNVKASVDLALSFIEPALRFQHIAVKLDLDAALSASGYPKEFAQVLLNILTNARDAFKEKNVAKPVIELRAFAENDKYVVTITDNAGGIPDTIIDKIFQLYFTTKESSGGTGIGLFISKNIIEKNMGGHLSVANVEQGAQFRIELDLRK
jgi:PAS domain S-box-containing protein